HSWGPERTYCGPSCRFECASLYRAAPTWSRTGPVSERPDEPFGDEPTPQRYRLAAGLGAPRRGPAEVAGAAGAEAAEVAFASREGAAEVEPCRGQASRDPFPHPDA